MLSAASNPGPASRDGNCHCSSCDRTAEINRKALDAQCIERRSP